MRNDMRVVAAGRPAPQKGGTDVCRRDYPPFNNHRYVGDRRRRVVHDLDRECHGPGGCQVSAIPLTDVVIFDPDTLKEAYRRGFENCPACIGE